MSAAAAAAAATAAAAGPRSPQAAAPSTAGSPAMGLLAVGGEHAHAAPAPSACVHTLCHTHSFFEPHAPPPPTHTHTHFLTLFCMLVPSGRVTNASVRSAKQSTETICCGQCRQSVSKITWNPYSYIWRSLERQRCVVLLLGGGVVLQAEEVWHRRPRVGCPTHMCVCVLWWWGGGCRRQCIL